MAVSIIIIIHLKVLYFQQSEIVPALQRKPPDPNGVQGVGGSNPLISNNNQVGLQEADNRRVADPFQLGANVQEDCQERKLWMQRWKFQILNGYGKFSGF